jgi:peroxiredoxin/predicted 2-oxoglutarate/Fe(II)-dependent dioxygenase YbiX
MPTMPSSTYINLEPGDPAPWFRQRSTTNPAYNFNTVAGRYVVLCFFGSAADPRGRAALAAVQANRTLFDDQRACFFGVSIDPADAAQERVRESIPGIRFFLDFDRAVSRAYGAVAREAANDGPMPSMRRFWLLLDPALRVLSVVPFAPDGSDGPTLFERLRRLPDPARYLGDIQAPVPVLMLPNVFEAELCRSLIGVYEQQGGEESGFMRDVGGKTALLHDHEHKRRKDCTVSDPALIDLIQNRVRRRIAPEILKVHYFKATRMERYIVACYLAEDGGHFRAHRDNTTKGTAHRRFAVSINLNDDFEGGGIGFPEYGGQEFRPPVGGAVVFSCSLLHAVSRVTKGRRFAFLPFLYDDVAAKIREANHQFLGEGYGDYKA